MTDEDQPLSGAKADEIAIQQNLNTLDSEADKLVDEAFGTIMPLEIAEEISEGTKYKPERYNLEMELLNILLKRKSYLTNNKIS